MEKATKIFIGLTGISSIEIADVMLNDPDVIQTLIKTIIQIMVGIATIYGILRKKKNRE
ncbi:MAG TPA: hypothetical protein VI727_01445 [Candidatus Brocadiaceae bacterium]|nr:hypothetical protein [Candidatus Brocadiaceae bacterium]